MLQYLQETPIDIALRYIVWCNVKNLNHILHFWNLRVHGFQTVYRLFKSVDILEEALISLLCIASLQTAEWYILK